MQKLSEIAHFKDAQNIVLHGFDPISAKGFTQVPNHLLNTPDLSANAKVVYAKLLSYAWNNDHVFPGQERMGEDVGMSQPTVARSIQELQKQEWLEVQRRGQGKTNLYVLKFRVTPKK
jgi:hypothetical protein